MPDNDTSAITRKVAIRCEQLGEERVRNDLATGYFTDEWRPHAERWLSKLDHDRAIEQQADAKRHAASAKNAAWIAAIAAMIAAVAAIASAVIAYLPSPS